MFKAWLIVCIAYIGSVFAGVDINPSFVDFGQIEIGDSDNQSIYILNEGEKDIVVEDISLFGHFDVNINNYCPDILTPGSECEIEVSLDCQELGVIDSAVEFEFRDLWPETIFVEGECIPSW